MRAHFSIGGCEVSKLTQSKQYLHAQLSVYSYKMGSTFLSARLCCEATNCQAGPNCGQPTGFQPLYWIFFEDVFQSFDKLRLAVLHIDNLQRRSMTYVWKCKRTYSGVA